MPKNTRRQSAKQLHSERLKKIRPYVEFNYDLRKPLSAAAKRKIKTYYDEIQALTNRPYQVFRPRTKAHRAEAQEFAQHEKVLPQLKVAFVPTNGHEKLKIRFTAKGVIAKSEHVTIEHIRLSTNALLRDAAAHVNERIKSTTAKQFTIQAGRYEIPAGFAREVIGAGVARYVSKYGNADKNNYFGNWLHGVFAHTFHGQDNIQSYLVEKQKSIRAGKRARASARKKELRKKQRG